MCSSRNKIADGAERQDLELSIHFVDEREYKEVSLPNTSGRRRWRKNRPSWFPLEDTSEDYSSSEDESSCSSEEDEEQNVIAGATMKGVTTMPTLTSKVMVKAMLTKAPALAPTKVRMRETRAKRKLLQRSKGQSFKLKRHRHKTNWGCEL